MQKFVQRCRKLVGLLGCAGAGSVEAHQPVATQGIIDSSSHAPSSSRLVGEEEDEEEVGEGEAGEEEGGGGDDGAGGEGVDNKGWLRGNAKLPKQVPATEEQKWLIEPTGKE